MTGASGVTTDVACISSWRISAIQLLSIVLAAALTFLSGLTISYYYLDQLFQDKADILFGGIENELVMFDHALNLIEADWDEELQQQMPKIARTLGEGHFDLVGELTPELLKKTAREHGLTDLYIINDDLVITAAGFEADIGLDMSQFTGEYTAYLRGLLNKGEVGVDRISVSTETGELKKYAYYSEPGSNLIINADIGVYDRIASDDQSSAIIKSLYEDVTKAIYHKHGELLDLDVFMISEANPMVAVYRGRQLTREIADRLYAGIPVSLTERDQVTLFKEVPFARYGSMGYEIYAMLTLDQSARTSLMLNALWYSAVGTLLLVLALLTPLISC